MLGQHAPDTLVGILGTGDEAQQYAALVCLRVHGFEAFGIESSANVEWKIRAPGADTFQAIVPT